MRPIAEILRNAGKSKTLRRAGLVAGGVVLAVSASGSLNVKPVDAQGSSPVPTPGATDVLIGQQPSPEPSAPAPLLKIDPATGECVSIVFEPNPNVQPANGEPVADVNNQVLSLLDASPAPQTTDGPITGQAEPTPANSPTPDPNIAEVSTYTKTDVDSFADCAPDQEAVKTIIVLVDPIEPVVTPEPTESSAPPSFEPIASQLPTPKDYKYFTDRHHDNVTFAEYTQNYQDFYANNSDKVQDPSNIIDTCGKILKTKKTQAEKLFDCTELFGEPFITYFTLKTPESQRIAEQDYDFFYNTFRTKTAREYFAAKVKKVYDILSKQ